MSLTTNMTGGPTLRYSMPSVKKSCKYESFGKATCCSNPFDSRDVPHADKNARPMVPNRTTHLKISPSLLRVSKNGICTDEIYFCRRDSLEEVAFVSVSTLSSDAATGTQQQHSILLPSIRFVSKTSNATNAVTCQYEQEKSLVVRWLKQVR